MFHFFFLYYLGQIDNCIGSHGAEVIGRQLEKNKTIKTLDLHDTQIFLYTTLTDNQFLFLRNKIRDGEILKSLETNATLTKLDLSGEYT